MKQFAKLNPHKVGIAAGLTFAGLSAAFQLFVMLFVRSGLKVPFLAGLVKGAVESSPAVRDVVITLTRHGFIAAFIALIFGAAIVFPVNYLLGRVFSTVYNKLLAK